MTDDNGTTLAWTAFGKAATVTQAGSNHLAFAYGPDDARIEKQAHVGSQTETVLYFSGAEQGRFNSKVQRPGLRGTPQGSPVGRFNSKVQHPRLRGTLQGNPIA